MDGLENDLKGQAQVIRIDLLSEIGRSAGSDFGVRIIPQTLVFDGEGREILRQSGIPDAGVIRTLVENTNKAAASR